MPAQSYSITGKVIDEATKAGVSKLLVEAWGNNALLSNSTTDEKGAYKISFVKADAKDQTLDIVLRVYADKKLVKSITIASIKSEQIIDISIQMTVLVPPKGKDQVSTEQMFKMAAFFQESDFAGLYKQYRSRANTSLGFLSDMVVNSLTKIDFNTPIKPTPKEEELQGQKTQDVKAQLKKQQIEVCVKPYNPKLNRASLKAFTLIPPDLQRGQHVHLYEESGIVRYYTVVGESCLDETDIPQTGDNQNADDIKRLQELQQELDLNKKTIVQKDQQIDELQKEIKAIRADQAEIKSILQSDAFAQFFKNVPGVEKKGPEDSTKGNQLDSIE